MPDTPAAAKADVRTPIGIHVLGADDPYIQVTVQKLPHTLEAIAPERGVGIQHQQVFSPALSHGDVVPRSQADIFRIQNSVDIFVTRRVVGDDLRGVIERRIIDQENLDWYGLIQKALDAVRYFRAGAVGDDNHRHSGGSDGGGR